MGAERQALSDQERRAASEKIWRRFNGYGPGIADEAGRLQVENERLREAVALHAGTLDDRALGHPEHNKRDRDSIDNELYNLVRRVDPSWWDQRVPGMGRSPRPIDDEGQTGDKPSCRGCAVEIGERHRTGCPYEHPWPRDRVDNVQSRIDPVSGASRETDAPKET